MLFYETGWYQKEVGHIAIEIILYVACGFAGTFPGNVLHVVYDMEALLMTVMSMSSGVSCCWGCTKCCSSSVGLLFPVEVSDGGDGRLTEVWSCCAAMSTLVTDLYCRWA